MEAVKFTLSGKNAFLKTGSKYLLLFYIWADS